MSNITEARIFEEVKTMTADEKHELAKAGSRKTDLSATLANLGKVPAMPVEGTRRP
jgi:hypothetical protein